MSAFKGLVASAAKWSVVGTLARLLVSYGMVLAAAPFMSTQEFGLFSFILVILNIGQFLGEGGLRDALIYRNQEVTRREFSSVFWLCFLLALSVLFLMWVAAPALSAIFKFSDLDSWIRIAAPIATIPAIGGPYQAFLEKDLRFKTLALIEVTSGLAGLALTVAWLFLGSALAALIWGMMLKAAIRTGLLLAVGTSQVALELKLSFASLKTAGRFGAFRTADIAFGMMMHRADQVLIAYFLGQEALGIYAFAWQIAVEPVLRLYVVLTQVLFPGLSKIKEDLARVTRVYCRGLKLIGAILLPIIAGIVVCSPVAVPMVFGQQWSDAVPLIEILAVVGAVCVVVGPSGSLLLSQGRSDITLYCTSGRFVLGCAAVIVAAAVGGLMSVAATVAGLYVLFLLVHPVLLVQRVLPNLRIGQILLTVSAPLLLSCLAAAVALVAADLGSGDGLGKLVIQGLVGAVVYTLGFLIVDREFVRDSFALLVLRPRAS
jgi:O-antigen/teichoic acid export membrane protein